MAVLVGFNPHVNQHVESGNRDAEAIKNTAEDKSQATSRDLATACPLPFAPAIRQFESFARLSR